MKKTKLKIDMLYDFPFFFSDEDYEGRGLGGTESYIVLSSRYLAELGHDVTIYSPSISDSFLSGYGVLWNSIHSLKKEDNRDMLLVLRTMSDVVKGCSAKKKAIVTLCRKNQGIKNWVIQNNINKVFSVSEYQRRTLINVDGLSPEIVYPSSAGVDFNAYTEVNNKIPGKCIYCSVPYRGLDVLIELWPEIKKQIPWATLFITSSYILWGKDRQDNDTICKDAYNKINKMRELGVYNLVCLPKKELIKHQCQSELMLYPSSYDEMCCVAALECAAAGCAIVTSDRAALSERVMHGISGYLIAGDCNSPEYKNRFIEYTVELLHNQRLRDSFKVSARNLAESFEYGKIIPDMLDIILSS